MRGRLELAGVLILAGKRLPVKDEELSPTHKASGTSGCRPTLKKSFTPHLLPDMPPAMIPQPRY
jgi:hypothetical protein